MSSPLVTIGIPTYNRANRYLKSAIASALGQSYGNIEVLVSDNASTDGTSDLIKEFSDSRLHYHRQGQNLGQRANMNFLVEHARGKYFLMYHDDDQIDKDFIETCVRAGEKRGNTGLIVTGSRVIDQDGVVVRTKENPAEGLSTEEWILSWYRKRLHLFLCCCLFGTRALRRAGGFDPHFGHFDDVAAEFKCAAEGGRVDVRDLKASFREHPDSGTSSARLGEWCRSSLALLDLAVSLAPAQERALMTEGKRTAAERNYRYASQAGTRSGIIKGYWTVMNSFGYRFYPPLQYWHQASPVFGYVASAFRLLARKRGRSGPAS